MQSRKATYAGGLGFFGGGGYRCLAMGLGRSDSLTHGANMLSRLNCSIVRKRLVNPQGKAVKSLPLQKRQVDVGSYGTRNVI